MLESFVKTLHPYRLLSPNECSNLSHSFSPCQIQLLGFHESIGENNSSLEQYEGEYWLSWGGHVDTQCTCHLGWWRFCSFVWKKNWKALASNLVDHTLIGCRCGSHWEVNRATQIIGWYSPICFLIHTSINMKQNYLHYNLCAHCMYPSCPLMGIKLD